MKLKYRFVPTGEYADFGQGRKKLYKIVLIEGPEYLKEYINGKEA